MSASDHLLTLFERLVATQEAHAANQRKLWAAFAGRMRAARVDAKISLREMARRMGVSAPTVSDWELGRRRWTRKRVEEFLSHLA
jgi:DNA-binding transcriptional regulator YiaG